LVIDFTAFSLFLYVALLAKPRTYPTDPSIPASSPAVEHTSILSRSIENGEEATRPVSETPTSQHNAATLHTPALNSDRKPTTDIDDSQDHAKNTLPAAMEETKDDSTEREPSNQALEAALQEAVRAEVDSHSQQRDEMDIEVSYTPGPAQLALDLPSDPVEEDNRSPEYSPTLTRTAPEMADRESDGYEPPDATAPTEAPESPPFSPAPPESIHEVADESMQDVNSTQALDEDERNTAKDTQPLINGTSQVLFDVNGFLLPPTASVR
jgi:hypothetical protein